MARLADADLPQLWGGVECTVNRVGEQYLDQVKLSGHHDRLTDLDLITSLGARTVRFPVLWERTSPGALADADWSWADPRLSRLRELNADLIVGLVHHGSGPSWTNLLDPRFPLHLAGYARAVAARYPWVASYTPVNEPLTTARFSGLYGHWFPHRRDAAAFARALVTQCQGIVLAMQAVRQVNPRAKLVQTEDIGQTFSTERLAYQASFDNERRWLTFDLLSGRVDSTHPMWQYLRDAGIDEATLAGFCDDPCPPDIIGLNYYVTSDRFLDERTERYPVWTRGGNGRHAYADVEAVRVSRDGIVGHEALVRSAWQRYGLPVAITEVHLGCSRDEQMRWFLEAWSAATSLRAHGVGVHAVTAWALLGSTDWDSLLTRSTGRYESGVFDVRAGAPRPTALVAMLQTLAARQPYEHPVLGAPGWWRREQRFAYPAVTCAQKPAFERAPSLRMRGRRGQRGKPLLITGATGTLGRAFATIAGERALEYRLTNRRDLDIADPTSVARTLAAVEPWAVINAAGYVRVDEAERDRQACFRENALGPAVLAQACQLRGTPLVTFSSDLVFDGEASAPYVESSSTCPLNVYGLSKAHAEALVRALAPSALIVRTSAFFGPWDTYNFITVTLRQLAAGRVVRASGDIVSPTYVPDLVDAALDLLIDGECGVWHLASEGACSWADFARRAAELAGFDPARVVEADVSLPAARPRYSALGSERGQLLPPLTTSLARYIEQVTDDLARLDAAG